MEKTNSSPSETVSLSTSVDSSNTAFYVKCGICLLIVGLIVFMTMRSTSDGPSSNTSLSKTSTDEKSGFNMNKEVQRIIEMQDRLQSRGAQ